MKRLTQIFNVIDIIILPFAFLMALMSPMAFDAPNSDKNLNSWLSALSFIVYPIILVVSLVLSRKYYKQERYKLSFWLSFILAIPGIYFLIKSLIMPIIANIFLY